MVELIFTLAFIMTQIAMGIGQTRSQLIPMVGTETVQIPGRDPVVIFGASPIRMGIKPSRTQAVALPPLPGV